MAVRVPKQQVGLSKRTLTLLAGAYDGPAQLKGGQVIERMNLRVAGERSEEWRRLQPFGWKRGVAVRQDARSDDGGPDDP